MNSINSITRLRYVCSKDPDLIVEYANKLVAYKIEIKGNPIFVQKKWFLWFILPEDLMQELPFGDLDKL